MTGLSVLLLLAGVAGAVWPPSRLPAGSVPAGAALLDVAFGAIGPGHVLTSLRPLWAAVGFLLSAVPLAVMLDRLGFFSAMASRVAGNGASPGRLWALAALVTTLLNLDTAVVLLTPLYVQVARRQGREALSLAVQPVLLACLASSALPVSNLTNLIVFSWSRPTTWSFISHLALPSVVATATGWLCYRAMVVVPHRNMQSKAVPERRTVPRRDLWTGGAVVATVAIGFTVVPLAGLGPWLVALCGDAFLACYLLLTAGRRPGAPPGIVPWRSVPLGTAVTVLSLGVLATAAAAHLPLASLLRGNSVLSLVGETGTAALGANVFNNLPTLLVALPYLGHRASGQMWAVLLGVNMGPVLLATGSLASLLWLSTLSRLGVPARPRDFTRFGARVGLPAAAAAVVVAVLMTATGLS